jgi:hypothetical protein
VGLCLGNLCHYFGAKNPEAVPRLLENLLTPDLQIILHPLYIIFITLHTEVFEKATGHLE